MIVMTQSQSITNLLQNNEMITNVIELTNLRELRKNLRDLIMIHWTFFLLLLYLYFPKITVQH